MLLTRLMLLTPFICMFISAHYNRLAYTVAFGVLSISFLILKAGGDFISLIVGALENSEDE